MQRTLRFPLLLAALLLSSCAANAPADRPRLVNSPGKADSASLRVRLTQSSPVVGAGILCEAPEGCTGVVDVRLRTPDPCVLLDDPRCGIGAMAPRVIELGTITIRSQTEGERTLPWRIETGDGDYISSSISVAFTALGGEEIDIELEQAIGGPDITVALVAAWTNVEPGAAEPSELLDYLGTIEGMTFQETSTGYSGYRAYELFYEQPLDHADPSAGTFVQRAVLHHVDRSNPMVLYTSGYALFYADYLAELTEGLGANQVNTEQRFFANSAPMGLSASDWRHVTIAQAAADHHRFVEALRPFYDGSWLSTGHSKGGMTSIYHRRFYPDDVDATVAYVAPISFALGDPRYLPFLDSIGSDSCRAHLRSLQHLILERFSEVEELAMMQATSEGYTYAHAGGLARSLETAVVAMEWGYWQSRGEAECGSLAQRSDLEPLGATDFFDWAAQYVSVGMPDQFLSNPEFDAYNYQAARELGYPAYATAHLADLLQHEVSPWWVPEGSMPTYDPNAMQDIQRWVLEEGNQILFLYGENDPWTGGAFDTAAAGEVMQVVVPGANHGAAIRDLDDADRTRALDALEMWIGQRPEIGSTFLPSRAPLPPRLLRENLPLPR